MRKILLLLLAILFVSCATKDGVKAEHIEQTVDDSATKNNAKNEHSAIATPTLIKTPSKSDIEDRLMDPDLLRNVEIASPASLRKAVQHIADDPKGLTDNNRLYLVIISEIMKRLYPHESIDWNIPSYRLANKYLKAFSDIDAGILPEDLGEDRFLSVIIPCFYVLSGSVDDEQISLIEKRLEKAKTMLPESVLTYLLAGHMYENSGQSSKAKNSYAKAYDLDKSSSQATLNYARILAKTGNSPSAINLLLGLENIKETKDYRLVLANSYLGLKQYDKAAEILESILEEDPENNEALFLRVRILIGRQEYLKANALLDAFASKNKTNKEYLLLRSDLVLKWSRSTSVALSLLSQAYERYPDDFDVLLACAQICFETGQSIQGNSAENFIALVTKKDVANAEAANLIVRNAIGNENWDFAVSKAKSLNETHPSIENRTLLVQAYLGAGDFTAALESSQKLYRETEGGVDSIIALYLESLNKTGNISEILRIISEKMPEASSSLKSVLYFYQARISSGELKLSYLRSSLLADPRNMDSLFAMYQYYYSSGDYKKSEYYLKQVIAIDPLNKKNARLLQELQTKL